ncbi:hypothetical protein KY284_007886 [Solanum tuberosum]|nr:hypothetical protein KY284_007886 [Solanum tuberosum]
MRHRWPQVGEYDPVRYRKAPPLLALGWVQVGILINLSARIRGSVVSWKYPPASFSGNQLHSTDHEQLLSHSTASCPTRSGGGDATSASASPSTILDRTWTERPGVLLYDGYKRGEYNDNPPKPQLPSPAGHKRYEAGDGQLCEPSLDRKHVESSRPSCGTNPLSQHATTLELTTPLQYAIELEPSSPATILHSPRGLRWQPTFLSMGSNTSSGTCNSKSLSNANGPSPTANMADWNKVQEEAPKGSFSEISTLIQATLMIFSEKEDKKYVHICPISLLKCSFDLRPAVNSAIAKYVVVMTSTLRPNQFLVKDDPLLVNPPTLYSPMINPTSFVVWNIRGGNNPAFKRNFRNLIHNHKPCMVALLETRMTSHVGLKDEFGFDDFFEVPEMGRSGFGLALEHFLGYCYSS